MTKTPEQVAADAVDRSWEALLNVDDRTLPEEYPDMALITFDELEGFILAALRERDAQHEARVGELERDYEAACRTLAMYRKGATTAQALADPFFASDEIDELARSVALAPPSPPADKRKGERRISYEVIKDVPSENRSGNDRRGRQTQPETSEVERD